MGLMSPRDEIAALLEEIPPVSLANKPVRKTSKQARRQKAGSKDQRKVEELNDELQKNGDGDDQEQAATLTPHPPSASNNQERSKGTSPRLHKGILKDWRQGGCPKCRKAQQKALQVSVEIDTLRQRNHWQRIRGQRVVGRMSSETRRMYMKVFELLDEDGSGALDFEEISLALKLVGLQSSLDQLRKDVDKYATDGELDFTGFLLVIDKSTHNDASKASPKPDEKAKTVDKVQKRRSSRGSNTRDSNGDLSLNKAEEENEDTNDSVLPFHLFLPAYSRKKNVEFVMSLELTEGSELPYPIGEGAAYDDLAARNSMEDALRRSQSCRSCRRHKNLSSIAKSLFTSQTPSTPSSSASVTAESP